MSLSYFESGRGVHQLRVVEPEGFDQTGIACFILGSCCPWCSANIGEGEYARLWREDLDVTWVNFIRARFRFRGPTENPPGFSWSLQLRIGTAIQVSFPILEGRTEDLIDIGVNVSKISGVQTFDLRLILL